MTAATIPPQRAALESVLVIDLGEVNTRAHYFDIVDGGYRLVASAAAPTSAGAPFSHVGYGMRAALEQLGSLCGKTFLDENGSLIRTHAAGMGGVDGFAFTYSLGTPVTAAIAGLHPAVSLAAARELAASVPLRITSEAYPGDGAMPAGRLEGWLRCPPEVFLLSGGTEGGAGADVLALARQIAMLCGMLAVEDRPKILYAGNSSLHAALARIFGEPIITDSESAGHGSGGLWLAPNLCPAEGCLNGRPARTRLGELLRRDRLVRIPGFRVPDAWSEGKSMPASLAMERTVRFLNAGEGRRRALGVDAGAFSVNVAAAHAGESTTVVIPKVERKANGTPFIAEERLKRVMDWLYLNASEDAVRDYLWNKLLFPASLPAGYRELAIEHAWTRAALREAAQALGSRFWAQGATGADALLPALEPLVASGSVLTRAPDAAYSALLLLDGLQPCGISVLLLDIQHLMAALGAAASLQPALSVQVIDSNAFSLLGTVVAPVCALPQGTPLLRVRMLSDSGADLRLELRMGELKTLPLAKGDSAELWLKPLHGADIGMGAGRGGRLSSVRGSALGVILDGRGRPFRLPADWNERRGMYRTWLTALRGETAC